jgi:tungstate transport system substrate-binding protein
MIRVVALILSIIVVSAAEAQDRFITLSSTTSTQDSGLFRHILPTFRAKTGIAVDVVAVGTGEALAIGERGDADALLVHDHIGENKFVADGYGIDRRHVMYNDFIIVGPNTDPAGIRGFNNARKALTQIAAAKASFVSRGDDSGFRTVLICISACRDQVRCSFVCSRAVIDVSPRFYIGSRFSVIYRKLGGRDASQAVWGG